MIKKIFIAIGVLGFLFIWGSFGAMDHEYIGIEQGFIQSGIGLCAVLLGFLGNKYLN